MDLKDLRRRRNAYVRGRLLSEKADKERGFNARLSEQLKVSTAHVSNWLHKGAGETGDMGERVAKLRWGMEPAELDELAAGVDLAGPSASAPKRTVEPLPGEARTTDDGRWRDFAAAHPAFLELATVKRGQAKAHPELLPIDLVEAALDITSDRLARAFGGATYTPGEVWAEYGRAWSLVKTGELPPAEPPAKVPERPAPAVVNVELEAPPPRQTLEEGENAFQAKLREAKLTSPAKKKGSTRP